MDPKYTSMILLGGVSILLGFLPLKVGKFFKDSQDGWRKSVLSVFLCFGGGVLFATALIHMLPEVRESIQNTGFDFKGAAMAEILMAAGFFLIYFIEETVHQFLDSNTQFHHHHDSRPRVHRNSTSVHAKEEETPLVSNYNTFDQRSILRGSKVFTLKSLLLSAFFNYFSLTFFLI